MNNNNQEQTNQSKKSNTKTLIALILLIIILIPFTISVYNKNSNKIDDEKTNPFYEEKVNNDNDDIIDKTTVDSEPLQEPVTEKTTTTVTNNKNTSTTAATTTQATIKNSYCDTNLTPVDGDFKNYIYYSAVHEGCALIEKENSKIVGEYTTKAYNKALNLKGKWADKYATENNNNTSYTYGKFTIKNSNGNTIGWAVTLTYNTGLKFETFALDSNDEWHLVKNNKY
jgi:hypothetical protein